jgi:sec-independent protein translocase protein TatA
MGLENPVHLLFIGIVALLVLGPKRLPDLARALGHGLREFREAVSQQGEAEQGPVLPAEPSHPPLAPAAVPAAPPPPPAATVEDTAAHPD